MMNGRPKHRLFTRIQRFEGTQWPDYMDKYVRTGNWNRCICDRLLVEPFCWA